MSRRVGFLVPGIRGLHEQRNALLEERIGLSMRLAESEEKTRALEAQLESQVAQIKAQTSKISGLTDRIAELTAKVSREGRLAKELSVCRVLAPRSTFIVGFARSSTTLTLQILNTAANALLLGEANFYLMNGATRFRDWYNIQHAHFGNQASKSTYAPDFVPHRDHAWWEWMEAASEHYEILGDKMALSSQHFSLADENAIRSFFESRFFEASYIFLLRNPIGTLLSTATLLRKNGDADLLRESDAWLRYVQLWANWIRTFPRTMTLIADEFGPESIDALGSFTRLPLADAKKLLNGGNRREHEVPADAPLFAKISGELMEIFEFAKAAVREDKVFWQAEQKRLIGENDNRGHEPGKIAVTPLPLGQACALAGALRERLSAIPAIWPTD